MSSDTIQRNADWFRETGQMPDDSLPSVRQSAFYAGMQCEELAEKLAAILGGQASIVADIAALAEHFKAGELDKQMEVAFTDPECVEEMLDADIDLLFVSVGAAMAQGANVAGAYNAVVSRNEEKKHPDGTYHRDPKTGKVLKPEGWQPPELQPFVNPKLRGFPNA